MPKGLLVALLFLSQSLEAQSGRPEDILVLRRFLGAHDFVRLDSALAARQRAARGRPDREQEYVYAYDAFDRDSTMRVHLDAWVAARPSSPWALQARGTNFFVRAGAARGRQWASETTPEQLTAMYAWLKLAVTDAEAAVRLDSTDMVAWGIMLDAARLGGDEPAERSLLARALAIDPTTLTLSIRHMHALQPRWFGSDEEMEAFAAASQRYAAQNPRLRALLGYRAFLRGEDLVGEDVQHKAIAAYTEALSHGDFWSYRRERGEMYMRTDQPEKALVDLTRTIRERPGQADALAWRAYAYASLAEAQVGAARDDLLRRGADDLRLALALDPTESMAEWARETYPELTLRRVSKRP
jgi:hypothetical protein